MSPLVYHDFLCACLRPCPDADARSQLAAWITMSGFSWPEAIRHAGERLVSPAVYTGLQRTGALEVVPADVAEYFEAMHCLNEERNRGVRRQIGEAVAALRTRGIEPVLLKSAAHLMSDVYRAPGDRFVRDIDLLVAPEAIDNAAECFRRLGYRSLSGACERVPRGKHLPTLVRDDAEVAVEIHRRVTRDAAEPLLAAADVLRDAEMTTSEGLRTRIPSLVHRMVHHVIHAHLENNGRDAAYFSLRRVMDVDALGRRLTKSGQWPEVFEPFDRCGQGRVVREYLYAAHRLCGAEVPVEEVATLRARWAWRRRRAQLRFPQLANFHMAAHCVRRTLYQMRHDAASRQRWLRQLRSFRFYGELPERIAAHLRSQA